MPACVICSASSPSNLCDACAGELDCPLPFIAEQILSTWVRPLDAALVDTWGRAHRLEARTAIGRLPIARGVSILDGSVSRRHAEIVRGAAGWQLVELGSTNGTRLNDQVVTGEHALTTHDRVSIGSVGFYFVAEASHLIDTDLHEVALRTLKPGDARRANVTRAEPAADATFAGLPAIDLQFLEAPSGGGGYLAIASRELQLTDTQFALLLTLARRIADEDDVAPVVRGFVPSGQLIADLPWDSSSPTENHLKQLIRRVRIVLDGVGLGTLIESRRGFGYRLRAVPRQPFEPAPSSSPAR